MDFGFGAVFLAGLLTFLSPCVLPLIPIYLATLVAPDSGSLEKVRRGQLLMRSLLFCVGFIVVFALMGLAAAGLGGLLHEHKGTLQLLGALILLGLGLRFLGVLRIPILDRVYQPDSSGMQSGSAAASSVLMGVVFALGWSPCAGPVLAAVLTYTASSTSDPIHGALLLSSYGAGFALPLLIFALLAEKSRNLIKRLSPVLPYVEKVVGIFLLVIAGALLFTYQSGGIERFPVVALPQAVQHEEGEPKLIEFYSKTCKICQKMEPIVAELTDVCDGEGVKIDLIEVRQPEHKELVRSHRIVAVPTFLFVDAEGREVARLIGMQSKAALMQALAALRGEPCPGVNFIEGESEALESSPEEEGCEVNLDSGEAAACEA